MSVSRLTPARPLSAPLCRSDGPDDLALIQARRLRRTGDRIEGGRVARLDRPVSRPEKRLVTRALGTRGHPPGQVGHITVAMSLAIIVALLPPRRRVEQLPGRAPGARGVAAPGPDHHV